MKDLDKILWRDALTLIAVTASWCSVCRTMEPVIDRFQEQTNGRADVFRIDSDDRNLAEFLRRYRIDAVPTLLFFCRGEMLWRRSGMISYNQLLTALDTVERYQHACQF